MYLVHVERMDALFHCNKAKLTFNGDVERGVAFAETIRHFSCVLS